MTATVVDARELAAGTRLEAQVCIVGAGPVGLTMAEALGRAGVDVLLLERGDRGSPRTDEDLGDVTGHAYFPLRATLARGIGGSSHLWPTKDALRCLRLDPIDVSARPEISREGWPFGFDELARWYPAAEEACGLPPIEARATTAAGDPGRETDRWEYAEHRALPFDPGVVRTRVARFAPIDHFRDGVSEHTARGQVRTVVNAGVLEVVGDETGRRVHHVVLSSGGRPVTAEASFVVLAGGAIETARLLLLSRRPWVDGAGNQHGLVGTHFMEHLHVWSGVLRPRMPELAGRLGLYRRHPSPVGDGLGMLTFTRRALIRASLGNVALHLCPMPPALVTNASRALTSLGRRVRYQPRRFEPEAFGWAAALARHPVDAAKAVSARTRRPPTPADAPVALMLQTEQQPNARSRVVLGSRADRQGQPVAALDWQLSDDDISSLGRAQRLLDQAVRQAGVGTVDGFFDEEATPPLVGGGYHHLGTARMASSPRSGVADADGRVFGIGNLFIAGGAAWPTGGFANPTLTSVALGLRMAQHLARELVVRPRVDHGDAPPRAKRTQG